MMHKAVKAALELVFYQVSHPAIIESTQEAHMHACNNFRAVVSSHTYMTVVAKTRLVQTRNHSVYIVTLLRPPQMGRAL